MTCDALLQALVVQAIGCGLVVSVLGCSAAEQAAAEKAEQAAREQAAIAKAEAAKAADSAANATAASTDSAAEPLDDPPTVTVAAAEPTAEQILASLRAAWAKIDDYHCTTDVFNKLGEATDTKKMDFYFKRPALFRNTVLEGLNKGGTVTLNADGVIHGQRGGVLGLIVITMEEDDERLRGLRGKRFFETGWGTEIDEFIALVDAGWKLQRADDQKFEGAACFVLVASGKLPKSKITRNELWIEQARNIIRRRKEFEADVMVRDVTYSNIELNKRPEKAFFTLK